MFLKYYTTVTIFWSLYNIIQFFFFKNSVKFNRCLGLGSISIFKRKFRTHLELIYRCFKNRQKSNQLSNYQSIKILTVISKSMFRCIINSLYSCKKNLPSRFADLAWVIIAWWKWGRDKLAWNIFNVITMGFLEKCINIE